MRKVLTFVLVMLGLVAAPARGQNQPLRVEIPYGFLVSDASCPGASHVLLDPCSPHAAEVYVVFPESGQARRYEGKNVFLRGEIVQGGCSLPLLRVSRIAPSTEAFTCQAPAEAR
jgi:hypothetical protein